MEAWASARSGPRAQFDALGPQLTDYVLFPYWQYEDLRHRRASVPPEEMAVFLEAHEDWAFTPGLRTAWLKTLGKQGKWDALLQFGADSSNTEVRCYHARARLARGQTDDLRSEARDLWAVGKSQPDACDPLFNWLISEGGVDRDLAWLRIQRAMEAGNPRLTLYLARFLPPGEREWLDRWQRLEKDRYRRLDRAANWRDNDLTRTISAISLARLSRYDGARAMALFDQLDGHFDWSDDLRGETMREIGLMAAVDLEPAAPAFIQRVPEVHRNDQLHEWWARVALSQEDWAGVRAALDGLSGEAVDDDRWRFWRARADLMLGDLEPGRAELEALAGKTNYYGFLAADALVMPYTICPRTPAVSEADIDALAQETRFHRALELHRAELDNWGIAEWSGATRALPTEQLKIAAGLARREGWHDRVIYALGDSGELQFYDWRFPVVFEEPIMRAAGDHDLEPAYLLGVMRSESALTESARSSAGALGLMQVTPATAKTLSRRHGLPYRSASELLQGDVNIRFGSMYLRDLLDEYDNNPVLVSAAYNAGPTALKRWLGSREIDEAAAWVETLSYYETRDYIPRVLTFTTLYDWRLQNPVRRIGARMPGIESGTMSLNETADVVCPALPDEVAAAGP